MYFILVFIFCTLQDTTVAMNSNINEQGILAEVEDLRAENIRLKNCIGKCLADTGPSIEQVPESCPDCTCENSFDQGLSTTTVTTTTTTTPTTTTTTNIPNTGSKKLFVGGWGNNGKVFKSSELFNQTICSHISLPRSDALMSFSDIFMCGIGEGNKDCVVFDNMTLTTHSRTQTDREGSVMTKIPTGLLVIGGGGGRTSSELLPLGETDWTSGPLTVPGEGVYRSCLVNLPGDRIVIIGGQNDPTQVRLYDFQSQEWSQWDPISPGLAFHDCIWTDAGVLVTGGTNMDTWETTEQTFLINVEGKQTPLGPMTETRQGHKLIMVDNIIYAVGGYTDNDDITSSIDEFVDSVRWVRSSFVLNTPRAYFAVLDIPTPDIC